MTTKTSILKTRKPKTNNFVLILERFLEKYNLTDKFILEQLSEHAPKLNASLPDCKARKCVKDALARRTENRCAFSKEQIEALVPDQRKSNGKLTIEERAKYCAKNGDALDIFTHHLDLGPKSNDDIIASCSRQSQFRVKLEEAGVDRKIINFCAKDKDRIQESNKIQKEQTKKRMAKPPRIPKHFSLANMQKRIQNMDVTKTPTREDLADVIVMLSMRPSEVRSLQINHYEPDPLKILKWYKEEYSWYCTGYRKSRGEKKKNPVPRPFLSIEKNPERAKELLTWIQDAIKAKKIRDPVYTESRTRNDTPFNKFLSQKPYKSLPGQLRDYGKRHASIIHGGKNPAPEYLKYLSRVVLRQESDRLDAGDNYTIGDTESEDSSPEDDHNSEPESESAENDEISEIINMYSY